MCPHGGARPQTPAWREASARRQGRLVIMSAVSLVAADCGRANIRLSSYYFHRRWWIARTRAADAAGRPHFPLQINCLQETPPSRFQVGQDLVGHGLEQGQ